MWLLLITISIAATTLLNKLLGFHAIHRHIFQCCSRRSDTRRQTRFENLTRYYCIDRNVSNPIGPQDPVTFNFGLLSSTKTIIVEIPANSRWQCLDHCHQTDGACIQMFTILTGAWIFGGGYWGERPFPRPIGREIRDDFGTFGKNVVQGGGRDATAELSFFSNGPRQLQHQVCSAVQDAEMYPKLCSTPAWIRLGLVLLRRGTSAMTYDWAVQRLLLVQIRAIFSGRDYLERHGTFTGLRWLFFPPPRWVQKFEAWSQRAISKAVLRLNLWLGVSVLGIKGWYPEYELVEGTKKL